MRLRLACLAALLAGLCWVGPASAAPTFSFERLTLTLPASFSDPWQLRVADLDGVNGPDIVVIGREGDLAVFLNNGDGTFQPPTFPSPACSSTESFVVGQFSAGDTNPDLLVDCYDRWHRLRGNGDGSFQPFDSSRDELLDIQPPGEGGGNTVAIMLGRFGTDGRGESVVYTQQDENPRSVRPCFFRVSDIVADLDSGGSYRPACAYWQWGASPRVLAAPPFLWPENVVFSNVDDHGVDWLQLHAHSKAGWSQAEYWLPPNSPYLPLTSAGHFIGGRTYPQLIGSWGPYFAVYDLGAGLVPGGLIPAPTLVSTGGPSAFATAPADYDRDGKLDLAVLAGYWGTGDSGSVVEIHPGRGDGTFGSYETFPTRAAVPGPGDLTVADFNGDHRPDLVNLDTYAPAGKPRSVTVLLNTTGQGLRHGGIIQSRLR